MGVLALIVALSLGLAAESALYLLLSINHPPGLEVLFNNTIMIHTASFGDALALYGVMMFTAWMLVFGTVYMVLGCLNFWTIRRESWRNFGILVVIALGIIFVIANYMSAAGFFTAAAY